MLLSLGAGAVALWRSQQARDKASQAFDMAKERLQDVSASLPSGEQDTQTAHGGQPQRSMPVTTTMLSQTAPDAGVSMSHGSTTSTTSSTSSSAASPAPTSGAMADIPADSLAEQSRATASELVQSSHQPDSMEVSGSSEQTHTAEEAAAAQSVAPPSAAAPPQPPGAGNTSTFTPANDPDAGQLDADGEDRTITDRIRTRLGQELEHAEWGHVNINTQALGAVYLRGYVASDELRSRIEQIASETEGVESVVNELNVEAQRQA
jgi:osmotically-inducible protein OsmY